MGSDPTRLRTFYDVAVWIRGQPDYILANEATVPYSTIYDIIERLLSQPEDAHLTLDDAAILLECAHRVACA